MRTLLTSANLGLASLTAPAAYADPYVTFDNGLRCVMAPCPSMNAANLKTRKVGRITGFDLDRLSQGDRDRLGDSPEALVLEGSIRIRRSGPAKQPGAELVVRKIERRSTWRERRMCNAG